MDKKVAKRAQASKPADETTPLKPEKGGAVSKPSGPPKQETVELPPNVQLMLNQKQQMLNEMAQRINAEIEMGVKFFLEGKGLQFNPDDIISLAPDNSVITITRVPPKK